MILATLCYIKHAGKTLMLRRNKRDADIHGGKWNGLGGKLKAHETPEECVIREVKEESGLTITHPVLRGILTFPEFGGGSQPETASQDWYVFVYTADCFSGELTESDEGELHWISDEDLPGLDLWEGDPVFLKWLEEGRFFSGKFCYRDGKLVSCSGVRY